MFDETEMEAPSMTNSSKSAMQLLVVQKVIEILRIFVAPSLCFLIVSGLAAYCMYDASVLRIVTLGVFAVFSLVFLIQRRSDK